MPKAADIGQGRAAEGGGARAAGAKQLAAGSHKLRTYLDSI